MAPFDNAAKALLEDLLSMSGGYVLDFTNASFADFVEGCIGFDPYQRYEGSKASILRQIWTREPFSDVARLNLDLIERWRVIQLRTDSEPSKYEQHILDTVVPIFESSNRPTLSADAIAFLDEDFGDIDLAALPTSLTTAKIVAARLAEIERCLLAEAPLAVIFLVGSTLEGLLAEVAQSHPAKFLSSPRAPRVKGNVKPIDAWTLGELIIVSQAVGVLSPDVSKHADQVRNFRNYIHPRQQLKEGFEPRIETARIAQHVLLAALKDLERLTAAAPAS